MRMALVLMIAAAACGSSPTTSDGGTPDLSSVSGDLAAGGQTLAINWALFNQSLLGKPGNDFQIACDDPSLNATMLVFTATNAASQSASTTGPCPAGANVGTQVVQLPDPNGPWTLSAVVQGKPMSSSVKVQNVTPGANVTLNIYAFGCDMPSCQ